ncbi:hypothetical protein QW060_24735 [Myroides ceti]|uniref:Uncharacterized protein n=1 Tax=Paenimyroides ceti TaxID=395087 RepID=A0ABT8D0H3_9FLAO|nr:hypothetical protein [Paenimyroides ceti]MDN3710102.1 hypothetical protein [Paenimyroides ceti]
MRKDSNHLILLLSDNSFSSVYTSSPEVTLTTRPDQLFHAVYSLSPLTTSDPDQKQTEVTNSKK